jgi:hypothetical protein
MTKLHRSLDAIRRDLSASRSAQASCAQFSREFQAAKRTTDTLSAELANAEYAARSSDKARHVRTTKPAPTLAARPVSRSITTTEPAAMRTDADIQALADVAVSSGTYLQDATWVMHQFASLTVDRSTAQGLLQHYARHPNINGSQLAMRNIDPRIESALIGSTVKRSQGKALTSVPRLAASADEKAVDAALDYYLKLRGYRT